MKQHADGAKSVIIITSLFGVDITSMIFGNPLTDNAIDNFGAVDYWHSHAIVSTKTAKGIQKHCDFNTVRPLLSYSISNKVGASLDC
eukprot:scaffold558197_cov19-Prasinocladus_malaysianus.AAC.1